MSQALKAPIFPRRVVSPVPASYDSWDVTRYATPEEPLLDPCPQISSSEPFDKKRLAGKCGPFVIIVCTVINQI